MNEQKELVTAYVVNCATTIGIQTVQAEIRTHRGKRHIFYRTEDYGHYVSGEGSSWTLDRAEAVKLATAKVAKAIKQIEAKLAKLKTLKFD